ncbi:MAG: hypothetical protein BWY88_00289 [Synergistetes bacterium ADurb.Bin520]|nr:MAG: hypothetical protein BWY88_00289 [Synergistetes bacterium ADurb.Bin520]
MHDGTLLQQSAGLSQDIQYSLRSLVQGKPSYQGNAFHEVSPVVHGVVDVQAIFYSGLEVVHPVPRSGVDTPCALVELHIIRQNQGQGLVVERMAGRQSFQIPASAALEDFPQL